MLTAPVERAHPVVPLALVIERLKPPSKKPQVILAAFNRSPMVLPDMLKFALVEEQTSPVGSASPISVIPPLPSATVAEATFRGLMTPLVWPEMRLTAPTVEGPKLVPKEWSLSA